MKLFMPHINGCVMGENAFFILSACFAEKNEKLTHQG